MANRLGQSELFVEAPSKKLIVGEGSVHFWGVDPSTLRVAIATIDPEVRRGVTMVSFDTRLGVVDRLPDIRRRTFDVAREIVEVLPPGVIVVEKPAGFGNRPNPELAYGVGAILCALGEAAPTAELRLVEGSRWKRVACGRGDIRKPKAKSGEMYAVLGWARSVGYDGVSWDEADAMGVAEFARRTYKLEAR